MSPPTSLTIALAAVLPDLPVANHCNNLFEPSFCSTKVFIAPVNIMTPAADASSKPASLAA